MIAIGILLGLFMLGLTVLLICATVDSCPAEKIKLQTYKCYQFVN